jgi:hypothetical protein
MILQLHGILAFWALNSGRGTGELFGLVAHIYDTQHMASLVRGRTAFYVAFASLIYILSPLSSGCVITVLHFDPSLTRGAVAQKRRRTNEHHPTRYQIHWESLKEDWNFQHQSFKQPQQLNCNFISFIIRKLATSASLPPITSKPFGSSELPSKLSI